MSKALVIYSGGMDSTVLLHRARQYYDDLYAITFNYGQRHNREIDCAKSQCKLCSVKQHKIVNMDFFKDISTISALTNTDINVPNARDVLGDPQSKVYVPFRNLLLLTTAASWAESLGVQDIYYGAVEVDSHSGFWDCSKDFIMKVNDVYSLNRKHQVVVNAPFAEWSKERVVKEGLDLGVNFSNTHTCYNGSEVGCGECVSCAARIKSFIDNKKIDPIPYAKYVDWEKYGCKHV